MTDIVERLRLSSHWNVAREAADEIERLRALVIDNSNAADKFHAEIERLRGAALEQKP